MYYLDNVIKMEKLKLPMLKLREINKRYQLM